MGGHAGGSPGDDGAAERGAGGGGGLGWFAYAMRAATGRLRASDRFYEPHDDAAERAKWGAKALKKLKKRELLALLERTDYDMGEEGNATPRAEDMWSIAVEASAMGRWQGFFSS